MTLAKLAHLGGPQDSLVRFDLPWRGENLPDPFLLYLVVIQTLQ